MESGMTSTTKQDIGEQPRDPLLQALELEEQQVDLQAKEMSVFINGMISQLSPSKFTHCIHRVPESVREMNPHCYTPRLVSIGPFHRDNPRLKSMEDLKLRFFKNFLDRPGTCEDKTAETFKYVAQRETNIRKYYPPDKIKLGSKDFCQMILLDAVFIIELLMTKKEDNPMIITHWQFCDLLNDILLIENQIPFFVPYKIYTKFSCAEGPFLELVNKFFESVMNEMYTTVKSLTNSWGQPSYKPENDPVHFLDYLRLAFTEYKQPFPRGNTPPQADVNVTASRLLEYGVNFEKVETNLLMDIQFESKVGILKIPRIKVNEWTENLFRNLVAFEQCYLYAPKHVSDYLIFMDSLIDTPEDVNILINAGIIQDHLQNPGKISEIFNTLHKEAITEERDYLFTLQSRDLNDYRRSLWNRWKATWYNSKLALKRDYLNSPWSTIAVIAAGVLLLLTIGQFVCAIIQVLQSSR